MINDAKFLQDNIRGCKYTDLMSLIKDFSSDR